MDLDKIIKTRRSIRKYKNKTPDWRKIIECIDSMRYAPMAGGIFTLKFILVSDKEKILKLAHAAQQPFVGSADYVVVVCSNPSRTINSYGEHGKIYTRQQAGAAMQTFLLKLHENSLASCWIGYFVKNQIKTLLKIPEEVQVEALFPIGYANEKPSEKNRVDLDGCLYFEEYKNKQMRYIKKIQ
jgi:nitroreductase